MNDYLQKIKNKLKNKLYGKYGAYHKVKTQTKNWRKVLATYLTDEGLVS